MNKVLQLLKSFLPTLLPIGLTAFNAFLDEVVALVGPIASTRDIKWVISNEIMHMPITKHRVAKQHFVRIIRKYAANQLAAHTVNVLKEEQAAEAAAAQAKASDDNKVLQDQRVP